MANADLLASAEAAKQVFSVEDIEDGARDERHFGHLILNADIEDKATILNLIQDMTKRLEDANTKIYQLPNIHSISGQLNENAIVQIELSDTFAEMLLKYEILTEDELSQRFSRSNLSSKTLGIFEDYAADTLYKLAETNIRPALKIVK